ncbi:MAG TPA: FkbM family methyltransferase [Steroidobacteraceae bacterium]|nr:FkbM family methyltransferase [Steroidobacteraceae bacterium]
MGMSLDERLDGLLGESLESVRARQVNTLEQLLGRLEQPFVLFGASHLGRKVQDRLKRLGYAPRAFIDNNPALWGTQIDSVPVFSPKQLAELDRNALPGVICTIWSGHLADRMPDRLAPLRRLGFGRIALFGHLAWRFPQGLLPHYCLDLPEKVLPDAQRIRRAFALLGDEESRQLFVDHVEWRLFLNHDLLPGASPRQIYFDRHFSTDFPGELVYDIGAFNGDSVADYLSRGRGYREIHSFEPSLANYGALQRHLDTLQPARGRGLHAHHLAVGDSSGEILIESGGGPSGRVGRGDERVPITTIDELAGQIGAATFIKIDIEGFEPQCLAGGRRLISENHPVMAVSAYHLQDHLWSLLLQLHDYYPDYRFSLCPHVSDGWDLVLYAVPPDRIPSQIA